MVQEFPRTLSPIPREIPGAVKKYTPPHVLVVDDERLVRWAVAETLAGHGYEISEAGDAASARELIMSGTHVPDLALLDLRLPDSDDLSLACFIQAHAPGTPIVIMTAFGTPDLLSEALSLGIAIVTKPFDMNELTKVVDRTLAR